MRVFIIITGFPGSSDGKAHTRTTHTCMHTHTTHTRAHAHTRGHGRGFLLGSAGLALTAGTTGWKHLSTGGLGAPGPPAEVHIIIKSLYILYI